MDGDTPHPPVPCSACAFLLQLLKQAVVAEEHVAVSTGHLDNCSSVE